MNVRHGSFRWVLIGVWSALLGSTLLFAASLRAQGTPSIQLVAPADGATVNGPVLIRITHSGIRFDGVKIGADPETGTGHWHVTVDGKFAGLSVSNVIDLPTDALPKIRAGKHTITAELHLNNHATFNPPVSQSITLNFAKDVALDTAISGPPRIQLEEPKPNADISGPIVIRTNITNFRLDGLMSGNDTQPNTGHWHVNIDGKYAGMSVSSILEVPNDSFPTLTAGTHTLTVYLHQNNHIATNPPVAQSIQINATKDITIAAASSASTATVAPTTSAASSTTGPTPSAAPTTTTAPTSQVAITTTALASVTTTALPGITSIPNTGQAGIDTTLPLTVSIVCLIMGGVMLYYSRRLRLIPATAQIGGGAVMSGGRMQMPEWIPDYLSRLLPDTAIQRLRGLRLPVLKTSTALSFAAGSSFGISISAGLLVVASSVSPNLVSIATPQVAVVAHQQPLAQPVVKNPAVVAPAPASNPASSQPAMVASLPQPELLPTGMKLAVADSWPFRLVSLNQPQEPFLIFRDGAHWMLLREAQQEPQPIPSGATTRMIELGTDSATLIRYPDNGFTFLWMVEDRSMQLSGVGLSDDQIVAAATSSRVRNPQMFQQDLMTAAAQQPLNVTTLWPTYLPEGMILDVAASTAEINQPTAASNADRYHIVFRQGDAQVAVSAGASIPAPVTGKAETITFGSLTGELTSNGQHFMLVVDSGTKLNAPYVAPANSTASPLPLVQHGRVSITADGVDRATFERIVAGLMSVRASEFVARASGQQVNALTYLWPSSLPAGYAVASHNVQYSWNDFLLQGGQPYFAVSMVGPDGETVTFKGGRQSNGKAFVLPEGPDVEQVDTTIHTLPATAARLQQGAVVVWLESGSYYTLSSSSMSVERLVAFGDRLKAIDNQTFYRNIAAVSPFEGNAPAASGIVDSGNAPHHTEGSQSPKAGSQSAVAQPVTKNASRAAVPVRLVIKKLGVDISVHGVGPDRNGDLAVPKHDVGWYKDSGRPTEGTKTILWGHVMRWKDSPQIPAPFADLHTLTPGDRLTIVTSDGERHTYAVERQLRITPDQVGYLAPTSFEEVMLISCIGDKIYVNGELTKAERLLTIAKPL